MSAEQRKLHRIGNDFGDDLKCKLSSGGRELICRVLDYNSLGIRILFATREDAEHARVHGVESAKVGFGNYQLGEFAFPEIRSGRASELEFIVLASESRSRSPVQREDRIDVPEILEPIATGPDPLRPREKFVMRILDISSSGFKAKCSLSNRHLMRGQILSGFSIQLPGIGAIKASFEITHLAADGRFLYLGCQFGGLGTKDRKLIQSFLLMCRLSAGDATLPDVRFAAKDALSQSLRVRRIDSVTDFQQVLALRLKAYLKANKVTDSTRPEDMTDEFDKNAIILGAFIGRRLVGTIRIVFSQDGSRFPFENYFPFPGLESGVVREESVEISKLAIDPEAQGSKVLFRIFQSFAIEFIPKKRFGILMATGTVARNYTLIGAKKISGALPHPVAKDQMLSLYVLDSRRLKSGRMSALAWLLFAREAIDFLARFGFARETRFPAIKIAQAPFEVIAKVARKMARRRRSKTGGV